MNREPGRIPDPVVRRLTKYLVHVSRLCAEGVQWISSKQIAQALGLTSSTVRQDLSYLDFSGRAKRGYETKKLKQALCEELGADRVTNVAIVGAGNLGRAMALHGDFERRGFAICAIFDSDPRLQGKKIGGLGVQELGELRNTVRRKRIDIGMLAVPASSAQEVADALVLAGVHGLLNLTPAHVKAPESVAIVDARIVASLQQLLHLMKVVENSESQEG